MSAFLFGLAVGLAVAWWVKRRADRHWLATNKAIHDGWASPDEGGRLGCSRFPEPGRFDVPNSVEAAAPESAPPPKPKR